MVLCVICANGEETHCDEIARRGKFTNLEKCLKFQTAFGQHADLIYSLKEVRATSRIDGINRHLIKYCEQM